MDSVTGNTIVGARDSSQSIISRFLFEIDNKWGFEQYKIYREKFVSDLLGLPAFREYPKGFSGEGDVDSGPLIFGLSASSTSISFGSAIQFNDKNLYMPILQSSEMAGFPMYYSNKKQYLFGLLPVGEEFVVWSKTAIHWIENSNDKYDLDLPDIVSQNWRVMIHVISFLIILAFILPIIILIYRMSKKKDTMINNIRSRLLFTNFRYERI